MLFSLLRMWCVWIFLTGLLVGCGTTPAERLDKQPVQAVAIAAAPQENVNNFTPVLRCVGTQIANYGTRRFLVGSDQIRNESGVRDGVPDSARTMLQSAFSTLVEHSNGKVVWAGWSSAVDTRVNAGFAQENKAWSKDAFVNETAEYSIFGAITQFEKALQKASRDTSLVMGSNRAGNYESADLSVLAAILTLHDNRHANFAVYRGIQANNVLTMKTIDDEAGVALGSTNIGGIGFNVSMVRKEGVSAALLNLMQLGAIEIAGKFYKDDFDYRHCLNPQSRQQILTSTAWKKEYVSQDQMHEKKKLRLSLQVADTPEFGKPLLFKVMANDIAYLYCFYSLADGSMVRVFPHAYVQNNQTFKGRAIFIPDEKMRIKIVPERNRSESVTCVISSVDISRIVTAYSTAVPSMNHSLDVLRQKLAEHISATAITFETIEW